MRLEKKLKKSGFTLIELLVIIAIIGIISTAAVISLNQAREKGKRAKIYSEMRSIIPAIQLCLYDGRSLLCGSSSGQSCTGSAAMKPTVGQVICTNSDTTWPDLKYDEYEWYRAVSSHTALTFGIEVKYKTGIFISGGGELGQYITCTETGCFKENWSSLISTDCAVYGQACGTCCHQSEGIPLICQGGVCQYNVGNLPENPEGGNL